MKIMKQTVVARSTGHSEMIALALLAEKIQACRDILAEPGYLTGSTHVLEDNQAVCLHRREETTKRLRARTIGGTEHLSTKL